MTREAIELKGSRPVDSGRTLDCVVVVLFHIFVCHALFAIPLFYCTGPPAGRGSLHQPWQRSSKG